MEIELVKLDHQEDFIEAIRKVFDGIKVDKPSNGHTNPLIDLSDSKLQNNIESLWLGDDNLQPIPSEWRGSDSDDYLGIDIRMETGTGKTYCYTNLMYELNELYGFHKFIILTPSTSIKAGSKNFLEADYRKRHFDDKYPNNKRINLSVLNSQKRSSNERKYFPLSIVEFLQGSSLEKNKFSVLLTNTEMFMSRKTMEKDDYDQTILGDYTQPYEALRSTNPIVIIDEPHRFKKENKTYKRILEELKPQCIFRFGATFPYKKGSKKKDFNNLIFNLGSKQAFNLNLVKGVETMMIDAEKQDSKKLKLMNVKLNPKQCTIRDESSNKTKTLVKEDNLAIFGKEFSGIYIQEIGGSPDVVGKYNITLSNGRAISQSDMIYGGVYTESYQELMIKQAINNHFETEKKNFLRSNKIKTLSLFFIDSIDSYRTDEFKPGHLRTFFEEELRKYIKNEINKIEEDAFERLLEYKEFLIASLEDITKTNGGYFSKDNSTADEDIREEVEKILNDKESLLSFKDEEGQWNTLRFIFSKWTLKEGWDNPNIFQIVKLRSSGSEISKLQEVGRGLRLPVDENGNRISDEQFYLKYLIDYSEKGFAAKLIGEIQDDEPEHVKNVEPLISKIIRQRGLDSDGISIEQLYDDLFEDMLSKNYINYKGVIQEEKLDELYQDYPEVIDGLAPNKVVDGNKPKNTVKIRKDNFSKIRSLWEAVNEKYYLEINSLTEDELGNMLFNILSQDNLFTKTVAHTTSQKTKRQDNNVVLENSVKGHFEINDKLTYGEFLKQLNLKIGLSIKYIHDLLCKYAKDNEVSEYLFSQQSLNTIIQKFNDKLDSQVIKHFSYRPLGIHRKETSLTDIDGKVKNELTQGVLGIYRAEDFKTPDQYIYNTVVYDSPKEKENILKSEIEEVIVFGKIPRRSIQIPLFSGGTTSPDFMYVIKQKDGEPQINFIVETKDVKAPQDIRGKEHINIASAKKFFEAMKNTGINVEFKEQFKEEDIVAMIKKLQ